MSAKPPVHEIRMGRVKACVWKNETPQGARHNVTVSRLFKDGEHWKESQSFGREELPLLCKVVDLAHMWIYEQKE